MYSVTAVISIVVLSVVSLEPRMAYGSEQTGELGVQCTAALEGRMVTASSGIWLRVPFAGTLMTRMPDGQMAPATSASIAIASEPCPRGKAHLLALDGAGQFDEKYDLETDTHIYCRGGKVEAERRVFPIRLRLTAPGCESVEVDFSGEAGSYALELACSSAALPASSHVADQGEAEGVGAQVALSDGILIVNKQNVHLPAKVAVLAELLGSPSEVARAAGDQYSNDVFEWEASGIFALARAGSETIHTLGFLLAPDRNDRHWCNPGTVQLSINGVEITRAASPTDIRRAGFRQAYHTFTLRRKGIYASMIAVGDPPDYYELEVGTE